MVYGQYACRFTIHCIYKLKGHDDMSLAKVLEVFFVELVFANRACFSNLERV